MTQPRRHALIVGGGIAGLSAAIALRDAGYDVTIFERATAIEPIGAALSLWGNAMTALERLGAAKRIRAEATPISSMMLADRRGRAIFGPHILPPGEAFMVTRSLLQSTLLSVLGGCDIRFGQAIDRVDQDRDGVRVTLTDGSVASGDIAAIADGIWSPTATALLGNPPVYRDYGGVLALSDGVAGVTAAGIAGEYQDDGERFGVFDIGDDRTYWFYMHDSADARSVDFLTVEGLERRAGSWPPIIRAAIAATPADRLHPFAIHARPAPTRLGEERILCSGDAAHAMEPNLGQGACQALEDAVAIGVAARRGPPDAILPDYERLRLKRVRSIVRQSAQASRSAHGNRIVQRLTRTTLQLVPAAVERRILARMHVMPDY